MRDARSARERIRNMKKLPRGVLNALKAYYEHRKVQESAKWDKNGDLKRLSEECAKHGIGFSAIAGTFCLYRKAIRWKVTEKNLPEGGLRWVERDKDSLDWKLG